MQFVAIGLGNIIVESGVKLGVGVFADACSATSKVQHGGRGNGHLGHAALSNLRLQVIEVGELYVFHMTHFIDHADHGRCQFLGAIGALDGDGYIGFHATHLLQKIDVEIGATEFAVGD